MFIANKKALKKRTCRLRFSIFFFCISLITRVRASTSMRPLLIDTSECLSLTDVLNVFPYESNGVCRLYTPVVVQSNSGTCTVRSIYVDLNMDPDHDPSIDRGTEYNRHLLDHPGYGENLWNEHMQDLEATSNYNSRQHQSLMVVSCEYQDSDGPKFSIPDTTDFNAVLQQPGDQTRVEVMKCYGPFCMLRITTQTCIRHKFEYVAVWPQTDRYYTKHATALYSMMGLASVMMKQRVTGPPKMGPDKGFSLSQIAGRKYKGLASHASQVMSVGVDYVCVSEANATCSLEEATEYGEKLFMYWRIASREGNEMSILVFDSIEKNDDSSSSIFVMKIAMLPFHGPGEVLGSFIHGNMECPEQSVPTNNTDTMQQEDGSIYKMECITCGINSYYDTIVTPRPAVLKTQEMFVVYQLIRDMFSSDMIAVHYITSDIDMALVESRDSNDIYKESIVDIGTTLILTTRLSAEPDGVGVDTTRLVASLDAVYFNTTFVRVECDNQTIEYNVVNTTSISFIVSREYAGRLISVHMLNSSDATPLPPVYIFPRADDVSQFCVNCPAGKFSGDHFVSGVSQCLDKNMPASGADASGVSENTEVSLYEYMVNVDKVRFTQGKAEIFMTYIEIEGSYVKIIAMQSALPQQPSSNFALQVWLESQDLELAQRSMVEIEAAVLKIYSANERKHGSRITWTQSDFGRTLTVKRNTHILIDSQPSHPFSISGEDVWRGPGPIGVDVDDKDMHSGQISFFVPKTYTGKLYYYCFEHEEMLRGEIIFVDPPPRADEIYTIPVNTRLFSPEGPVVLLIEGRYGTTMDDNPVDGVVEDEIVSPFVVTMAVAIPLTVAEFDVTKQTKFREAVATTAGVPSSDVKITSIESIVGTRRLLAASIRVDILVNAATQNAANTVSSGLTANSLNAQLQQSGLPAASVLQVPVAVASTPTNNNAVSTQSSSSSGISSRMMWLVLVAGVAFILCAAIAAYCIIYKMTRKHTQFEQPFAAAPYANSDFQHNSVLYSSVPAGQPYMSAPPYA